MNKLIAELRNLKGKINKPCLISIYFVNELKIKISWDLNNKYFIQKVFTLSEIINTTGTSISLIDNLIEEVNDAIENQKDN